MIMIICTSINECINFIYCKVRSEATSDLRILNIYRICKLKVYKEWEISIELVIKAIFVSVNKVLAVTGQDEKEIVLWELRILDVLHDMAGYSDLRCEYIPYLNRTGK